MKKQVIGQLVIGLIVVILIVISACSDDKGAETPSTNLSGTWEVKETVTDNCGGLSIEEEIDIITIKQDGNDAEITFLSKSQTFDGTISGNDLKWKGIMLESDGSSSVSFSGKVSERFSIACRRNTLSDAY